MITNSPPDYWSIWGRKLPFRFVANDPVVLTFARYGSRDFEGEARACWIGRAFSISDVRQSFAKDFQ
jgi:hypothetical protein